MRCQIGIYPGNGRVDKFAEESDTWSQNYQQKKVALVTEVSRSCTHRAANPLTLVLFPGLPLNVGRITLPAANFCYSYQIGPDIAVPHQNRKVIKKQQKETTCQHLRPK